VALNDKYLDKFRNFENIVFESNWSPTEEFDKIRHAAKSNNPKTLIAAMKRGYGAEKVTIARNHPLGTLEWRGPRNFIYPGNIQVIRKFMARIYRLVLDINNILENEQSLGGIISRQQFMDIMEKESQFEFSKRKPRKPGRKWGIQQWMTKFNNVRPVEGNEDYFVTLTLEERPTNDPKNPIEYIRHEGLATKIGKEKLPPIYDEIYYDQYFGVFYVKDKAKGVTYVYDYKEEKFIDTVAFTGLVRNYSGKFHIAGGSVYSQSGDSKYGFVDGNGVVIPLVYDAIGMVLEKGNEPFFPVRQKILDNDAWGIINKNNEIIVPFEYKWKDQLYKAWTEMGGNVPQ
jgi:hypothetical protein